MRKLLKVVFCFLFFKIKYDVKPVKANNEWHVKYHVRIIWIYLIGILLSPVLILIGGIPNLIEKFKKEHPLRLHMGYHVITLTRKQRLSMWECYAIY
jgi:hypothetical protein